MTRKAKIILSVTLGLLVLAGYYFRIPLFEMGVKTYDVLTDREAIKAYILSWGMAAPVVFTGIQILQVVLAPIPGEATGFIGGYLFGALNGFLYSSIGLAAGSLINFGIGRVLGKQFVRKLIPASQIKQLDRAGSPARRHCPVYLFFVSRIPQGLSLPVSGHQRYSFQAFFCHGNLRPDARNPGAQRSGRFPVSAAVCPVGRYHDDLHRVCLAVLSLQG